MSKVKSEIALSNRVRDFFRRNFKSQSTTEIELAKCRFDVVGFNAQEECFYIAETKAGSNPTDIGHAFGQILTYEAVISQHGYLFSKEFLRRVHVRDVDAIHNMFTEKHVRVKFFVALTNKACLNYDLIRSLKGRIPHVGIIRIKDRCKMYLRDESGQKDERICQSEAIDVNLSRHFDKAGFLREIMREVKLQHPELTTSYHNYLQFRFGHSAFHLEAMVHRKSLTLSLDVEPSRRKYKENFFDFVARRKSRIIKNIENVDIQRNWLKGGVWGRIVVTFKEPTLDDDLLLKSVNTLDRIYTTMKPIVEDFASSPQSN